MGPENDSAAKFLERFAETWGTGDSQGLGRMFSDDSSLVTPFGHRADGRQAVTDMYRQFFGGMLGGTTTTVTIESLRPLGDSLAFVDAQQVITGANGDVLLEVKLAALLRRDGEDWCFVDSRPYVLADLPG